MRGGSRSGWTINLTSARVLRGFDRLKRRPDMETTPMPDFGPEPSSPGMSMSAKLILVICAVLLAISWMNTITMVGGGVALLVGIVTLRRSRQSSDVILFEPGALTGNQPDAFGTFEENEGPSAPSYVLPDEVSDSMACDEPVTPIQVDLPGECDVDESVAASPFTVDETADIPSPLAASQPDVANEMMTPPSIAAPTPPDAAVADADHEEGSQTDPVPTAIPLDVVKDVADEHHDDHEVPVAAEIAFGNTPTTGTDTKKVEEEWQQRLSREQERQTDLSARLAAESQSRQNLASELQESIGKQHELAQRIEAERLRCADLESQLAQAMEGQRTLSTQIESARQQNSDLAAEFQAFKSKADARFNEKQQAFDDVKVKLVQAIEETQKRDQVIDQLKVEATNVETAHREECDRLTEKIADAERQVTKLDSDLKTSIETLASTKTALEGEIHDLRSNLATTESSLQSYGHFVSVVSQRVIESFDDFNTHIDSVRETRLKKAPALSLERSVSCILTAKSLFEGMSDIARLEEGRKKIRAHVFDIRDLVEGSVNEMVERTDNPDLVLTQEVSAAIPPFLRGDSDRTRQVLEHLMRHLIQLDESRKVRVSVDSSGDGDSCSSIKVVLSGSGGRIDLCYGRAEGGLNVANLLSLNPDTLFADLLIAKRLVELMNGSMGIEQNENRRIMIWFSIPVDEVKIDDDERRMHARFSTEHLKCSMGKVLDLSLGGAKVESSRGHTGLVTVKFMDGDEWVEVKAEVTRHIKLGFRRHDIGLRFLNPRNELTERLSQLAMIHRCQKSAEWVSSGEAA